MRDQRQLPRRLTAVVLSGLLLAAVACGSKTDDDDDAGGSNESSDEGFAELLGPEDEATGEPVRVGLVSDGATAAFDNTDELRAGEATVEYWNTHRGGIGGRPIELVTCETGADPGGATDCGNQMAEEDVVAVALSQSAVAESVWEPIHASGIPTM